MSTPNLNKPNFKDDTLYDHGEDPNDKKKFRPSSAPRPMPQPGDYAFLCPPDFGSSYEEITGKFQNQDMAGLRWFHGKRADGKPDGEPLRFYGGPYDGDPLKFYSFTTIPRERFGGEFASDALYFFRDGFGLTVPQQVNKGVWWELAQQVAGRPFGAYLEYQASCNPKRVRFINGAEDPKGTPGCNMKFYHKDFEAARVKAGSKLYSPNIICKCGASLTAFPNLTGFRKVKVQDPGEAQE